MTIGNEGTKGRPSLPGIPSAPALPGTPSKPGSPGTPSLPSKPGRPGIPISPFGPREPIGPSMPIGPGSPTSPRLPFGPGIPKTITLPTFTTRCLPGKPGGPVGPFGPTGPSNPCGPGGQYSWVLLQKPYFIAYFLEQLQYKQQSSNNFLYLYCEQYELVCWLLAEKKLFVVIECCYWVDSLVGWFASLLLHWLLLPGRIALTYLPCMDDGDEEISRRCLCCNTIVLEVS
uniref:Accumulation-associated protein n=1 Tax=Glossina austeni TaxID=7395 RepID=A0A1A9VU61_GLOAU